VRCPLCNQGLKKEPYYETQNEVQMICNGYFLYMMRDGEEPKWIEFTFWRDGHIEFDVSYPNCCRITFDEDLTAHRKWQ